MKHYVFRARRTPTRNRSSRRTPFGLPFVIGLILIGIAAIVVVSVLYDMVAKRKPKK